MSKVLEASCLAGVVTADGLPLAGATVLSQGVAASSGVAILDEDGIWYLPDGTPDLQTTLDKLVDTLTQVKAALDQTVTALNQAAAAFTLVDAKPTGGTGSIVVPTVTANVSAITTAAGSVSTASTAIAAIKTAVQTFQGAMI